MNKIRFSQAAVGLVMILAHVLSIIPLTLVQAQDGASPAIYGNALYFDRDQSDAGGTGEVLFPFYAFPAGVTYLSAMGGAETSSYRTGGAVLGWRQLWGAGESVMSDFYFGGDFTRAGGYDYQQLVFGGALQWTEWLGARVNYTLPDDQRDRIGREKVETTQEFESVTNRGFAISPRGPYATENRIEQQVLKGYDRITTTTTLHQRNVFERYQVPLGGVEAVVELGLPVLPATLPKIYGGYTSLDAEEAVIAETEGYLAGVNWRLTNGLSIDAGYREVVGRSDVTDGGEWSVGLQFGVELREDGLRDAFQWYRAGEKSLRRHLNEPVRRRAGVQVAATPWMENEAMFKRTVNTEVEQKRFVTDVRTFVLEDNLIFVSVDGVPTATPDANKAPGMAENPFADLQLALNEGVVVSVNDPWRVLVFDKPNHDPWVGDYSIAALDNTKLTVMSAHKLVTGALVFDSQCNIIGTTPFQLTTKQALVDGGFFAQGSGVTGEEITIWGFEGRTGHSAFGDFNAEGFVLSKNTDRLTVLENNISQLETGRAIHHINDESTLGGQVFVARGNQISNNFTGIDVSVRDTGGVTAQEVFIQDNSFSGDFIGVNLTANAPANSVLLGGVIGGNTFDGNNFGVNLFATGENSEMGGMLPLGITGNQFTNIAAAGITQSSVQSGEIVTTIGNNTMELFGFEAVGVDNYSENSGSKIETIYNGNEFSDTIDANASAGVRIATNSSSFQNHIFIGEDYRNFADAGIEATAQDESVLNLALLFGNVLTENGDGAEVTDASLSVSVTDNSSLNLTIDGNNDFSESWFGARVVVGNFDPSDQSTASIAVNDGNQFVDNSSNGFSLLLNGAAILNSLAVTGNNNFSGNTGSGLFVGTTGDIVTESIEISGGNTFTGNGSSGANLFFSALDGHAQSVESILIDGNTFFDNSTGLALTFLVFAEGVAGSISVDDLGVYNNLFEANSNQGMIFSARATNGAVNFSDNNANLLPMEFVGNTALGNGEEGMRWDFQVLDDDDNGVLSTIVKNSALYVDNNTLTDNALSGYQVNVESNGVDAFFLTGDFIIDNTGGNTTISGNGGEAQVEFNVISTGAVSGKVIVDSVAISQLNLEVGGAETSGIAIISDGEFAAIKDLFLSNNIVTSQGHSGIYLRTDNGGEIGAIGGNVLIVGNEVTNSNTANSINHGGITLYSDAGGLIDVGLLNFNVLTGNNQSQLYAHTNGNNTDLIIDNFNDNVFSGLGTPDIANMDFVRLEHLSPGGTFTFNGIDSNDFSDRGASDKLLEVEGFAIGGTFVILAPEWGAVVPTVIPSTVDYP